MNTENTLRELVNKYFDTNKETNKDTLLRFLIDNEWRIYDSYDKQCKRTDIRLELDEREMQYTDKDIESILETYEDYLTDSGCWRDCLNEAISTYFED